MKKTVLVLVAMWLSLAGWSQHLETSIKLVGGKARIAVRAVGGAITGSPSGTTFCVAIPASNSTALMTAPTILDASRLPAPGSLQTGNYSDGDKKYFILLWAGGTPPVTFADGVEYELVELNWTVSGGPSLNFPVSLTSLPEGNPAAPVLPSQWITYLEVGGTQYSFGDRLFYQSTSSNAPVQMAADYSSGTAVVTTNATIFVLPVNLLNFSGYKAGSKNVLRWATSSEQNNQGFEVQRSSDGMSYTTIGFVNSLAQGGNSSTELNYVFDDNSPAASRRSYYRLNQKDLDGRSRLSNVVMINGDKPTSVNIGGIFPNPATQLVNVIIETPKRDDVTVVVLDALGKTVKQKLVNVEIGSNTVPVEIGGLASGSYVVKVVCKTLDCQAAVSKFVKQ